MAGKSEWDCWTLCIEDIDHAARKLDINPLDFTEDDYENIARKFIRGFERANQEWAGILRETVTLHMAEKRTMKRTGDIYVDTYRLP
jgi:hypothetical protein